MDHLLQALAKRTYHDRQAALWQGVPNTSTGTLNLVYDNEFVNETYHKVLVQHGGNVVCGVNLPVSLWLGPRHTYIKMRGEREDLWILHDEGALEPNKWWNTLRSTYPEIPELRGDLVFALQGQDLQWDKPRFMTEIAKWLVCTYHDKSLHKFCV